MLCAINFSDVPIIHSLSQSLLKNASPTRPDSIYKRANYVVHCFARVVTVTTATVVVLGLVVVVGYCELSGCSAGKVVPGRQQIEQRNKIEKNKREMHTEHSSFFFCVTERIKF